MKLGQEKQNSKSERRAFWRVVSFTKNSRENLSNFFVLGVIIN